MLFYDDPFPDKKYEKIISVVPSITELLYDLGLNQEVVGITKFCVHPDNWFRNKERIGGTKNLNLEKIKSLGTQLILANKEENLKEEVEEISLFCDVWVTDVNNFNESLELIEKTGIITRKTDAANKLVQKVQEQFNFLDRNLKPFIFQKLKAAYLIWKDPFMAAGSGTFINSMLEKCYLENLFAHAPRYPQIKIEDLADADVIILSSEPYPFQSKHVKWFQEIYPNKKIITADGEMFSWYGSRLLYAPEYFYKMMKGLTKIN